MHVELYITCRFLIKAEISWKNVSESHKYQVPQKFVQLDSRWSMGRIDGRTDILRLIVNIVTAVSTGVEEGVYTWAVKKYASMYFFRISRLVKCNFTSQWSFPWPTDWSWLSTKAATQVSEFNLLTVMFVWVDYRSGIREKNTNKVCISGLQFECCSSRTRQL
jgi:hypothetical protein